MGEKLTETGGITFAELVDAFKDVAVHMIGAASAYKAHARRHSSVNPKSSIDPLFRTRSADFNKAAKRARAVYRALAAGRQALDQNGGEHGG